MHSCDSLYNLFSEKLKFNNICACITFITVTRTKLAVHWVLHVIYFQNQCYISKLYIFNYIESSQKWNKVHKVSPISNLDNFIHWINAFILMFVYIGRFMYKIEQNKVTVLSVTDYIKWCPSIQCWTPYWCAIGILVVLFSIHALWLHTVKVF